MLVTSCTGDAKKEAEATCVEHLGEDHPMSADFLVSIRGMILSWSYFEWSVQYVRFPEYISWTSKRETLNKRYESCHYTPTNHNTPVCPCFYPHNMSGKVART